jgi:histidinol-phosphatase (PHP family)
LNDSGLRIAAIAFSARCRTAGSSIRAKASSRLIGFVVDGVRAAALSAAARHADGSALLERGMSAANVVWIFDSAGASPVRQRQPAGAGAWPEPGALLSAHPRSGRPGAYPSIRGIHSAPCSCLARRVSSGSIGRVTPSLPPDYHMHTPLCRHAVGMPTEYARQAKTVGLREIGFSDHAPMPRDDFDDWRMRLDQLDAYVESVTQAQAEHPDLVIRLALEVDYLPGAEDWVRDLAGRHRWDYLIGSVHYITETWDIDNPGKIEQWKSRPVGEVWAAYFERLAQAAASGLFDILGHADLPKKFGFIPQGDCASMFEPFLQAARRAGTAVELNTAGLRKPCREIYPSLTLLTRACQVGVPITFGSDAHAPGEVGLNLADAVLWARQAGYADSIQFDGRARVSRPL